MIEKPIGTNLAEARRIQALPIERQSGGGAQHPGEPRARQRIELLEGELRRTQHRPDVPRDPESDAIDHQVLDGSSARATRDGARRSTPL